MNVIKNAFVKSMRKAPTKDTTNHAFGDGPYLEAKDNMFTKAFGVAPNPKPIAPAPNITES